MDLQELSMQYRTTAERVEDRLYILKEQRKHVLGEESILLESRIAALYAELLELRKTAFYLANYEQEDKGYGFQTQS
ncbi:hypothetical protein [Zongyangia hominis]|uniref:Uncharacterized protein n=1 Tax=Zongyangia hominis TaxID=2763677 RepID=A0A926IBW3_9FIRM|nr:hypothetical protein [Zongyangia hominis]MBC8570602.1 hypothetical protein [Zongyangia hominis]